MLFFIHAPAQRPGAWLNAACDALHRCLALHPRGQAFYAPLPSYAPLPALCVICVVGTFHILALSSFNFARPTREVVPVSDIWRSQILIGRRPRACWLLPYMAATSPATISPKGTTERYNARPTPRPSVGFANESAPRTRPFVRCSSNVRPL
jgi:hypothetical protein